MKTFAALTIASTIAIFAATGFDANAEASLNDGDAVSKIVEILRPRMNVLDRETMTFHYTTTNVEPQISSQEQIRDWAGEMSDQFYNLDAISGDMQGVGYYVATDPHSTRTYGSPTNPLLFATPIKKGALILNLRFKTSNDEIDVRQLQNLSDQFGCAVETHQGDLFNIEGVTSIFRNSKDLRCRKIITDAYRALGVEAILYTYNSDAFPNECRPRSDAFSIIDHNAIAETGSALFWQDGYFSSKTFARLVGQTYKDAHDEFYTRLAAIYYPGSDTYFIPNSLKDLGTFERSARSWRKRNLLRCGPRWSIEINSSKLDALNESLRTSLVGIVDQNSLLDWFRAYESRFKTGYLDPLRPQRILAVEKSVYLSFGLPQDLSRLDEFRKASDLIRNGEGTVTDRDRQAAQILGETAPSVSDKELNELASRQVDILFDANHRQPGLLGNVLLRLGYGTRVATLKVNQLISYLGGSISVSTLAPMDAGIDQSDIVYRNRADYLQIIQRCTQMMNNPSVTNSAILASDCAVREVPNPGSQPSTIEKSQGQETAP